jgi:hypothetical protein
METLWASLSVLASLFCADVVRLVPMRIPNEPKAALPDDISPSRERERWGRGEGEGRGREDGSRHGPERLPKTTTHFRPIIYCAPRGGPAPLISNF